MQPMTSSSSSVFGLSLSARSKLSVPKQGVGQKVLGVEVRMVRAKVQIHDERFLRRVLWADTTLGSLTALVGLFFPARLVDLFGMPLGLIIVIAVVTLAYAVTALTIAVQTSFPVLSVRVLVWANWFWAAVSTVLLLRHFAAATVLGVAFLVLQIFVVGGLAYIEGRQIVRQTAKPAQEPA